MELAQASSLHSVATTETSLRISQLLLTNKKAFTDGPVVKDCIRTAASVPIPSGLESRYSSSAISTAINNIQLVSRRCEFLGKDLLHQLLSNLSTCDCFALALDESTDVTDLSLMCVFVRFVHDFVVKKDILAFIPLSDTIRGINCKTH